MVLLLKLGIGVLAAATILYSAVVALVALQGFFPSSCEVNPICRVLQIRAPTEHIGVLVFVGVNCAILGNLWWAITWAAGEAAGRGHTGAPMRFLQVTANVARWIFWATCGATLLLPLIFVLFWLAFHVLGLIAVVPVLIYKLLNLA